MEFINLHKTEFVGIVLLLVVFTSCRKFVALEPPKNQLQSSSIFKNEEAAVSAVAGLYSKVGSSLQLSSGAEALYTGLTSDEIVNTTSSGSLDAFSQNSLLPSTGTLITFWQSAYPSIYHANSVIEGLDASVEINEGLKRQLKGEMLFIRSMMYFYMVNLFGDVPLVTSTNYEQNANLGRETKEKVMRQIVDDLKEAMNLMKEEYQTTNKGRANRWTAAALLARVYLYEGRYKEAEDIASSIINQGMYGLGSIGGVFLSGSQETIFQWIKDKSNTSIAPSFIPSSASTRPVYKITDYLLSAFEPGDLRKKSWINSNTVGGVVYSYPYKYKVRVASPITEYYIVFRLAEQYLIRTEARAMQGNTGDAVSDLNLIRKRAGLPNLPLSLTKEEVIMAVEQERRVELFTEGHRWFDLKRTGKADGTLSMIKGSYWQTTDKLYPIPESELLKNPALTQNPGY